MYFQSSIPIVILTLFTCTLFTRVHSVEDEPVEYGVDVSFPIHNTQVSTNYPWLPHNVDPVHNPTPTKYKNMPLQVLGDRDQFYKDFMKGCNLKYPKVSNKHVFKYMEYYPYCIASHFILIRFFFFTCTPNQRPYDFFIHY
jgi:hypothetical protein